MAFKKGISGNPLGRRKGTKNIASGEVKELVLSILKKDFNIVKVSKDLKALKPHQRLNFFIRLATLVLPKEQELKIDYEKLSDSDLDLIINELKNQDDK